MIAPDARGSLTMCPAMKLWPIRTSKATHVDHAATNRNAVLMVLFRLLYSLRLKYRVDIFDMAVISPSVVMHSKRP